MTDLVSVADGLYAQPDYNFLPPSVVAWAGYVGKPSINAWTHGQVAALEATGRLWIPIWTPGDGATYTRAEAQADAASMLAGLHALGISDQRWVFLDVERSRWAPTPAQTEDAASHWCDIMRASGWPRAGWYSACQSPATWRACWTGVPPDVLPPGALGVQYDHALADDRYDISRFDPSILQKGNPVSSPTDIAASVWAEGIKYGANGATILAKDRLAEIDHHVGVDLPAQLADLRNQLGVTQQMITQLQNAVATIVSGQGPAQYNGTITLHAGP